MPPTSSFLCISERDFLQHHAVASALGIHGEHDDPEGHVGLEVVEEEVRLRIGSHVESGYSGIGGVQFEEEMLR